MPYFIKSKIPLIESTLSFYVTLKTTILAIKLQHTAKTPWVSRFLPISEVSKCEKLTTLYLYLSHKYLLKEWKSIFSIWLLATQEQNLHLNHLSFPQTGHGTEQALNPFYVNWFDFRSSPFFSVPGEGEAEMKQIRLQSSRTSNSDNNGNNNKTTIITTIHWTFTMWKYFMIIFTYIFLSTFYFLLHLFTYTLFEFLDLRWVSCRLNP